MDQAVVNFVLFLNIPALSLHFPSTTKHPLSSR